MDDRYEFFAGFDKDGLQGVLYFEDTSFRLNGFYKYDDVYRSTRDQVRALACDLSHELSDNGTVGSDALDNVEFRDLDGCRKLSMDNWLEFFREGYGVD